MGSVAVFKVATWLEALLSNEKRIHHINPSSQEIGQAQLIKQLFNGLKKQNVLIA